MPLNFLNNGYFAGKVGIGTKSPGSKLTVNETSTATAALNIVTARYGISLQGAGTSNTQYLLNLQSNGGSTDVMRVQSSGNVGIGTTSPNAKLEINSSITFSTIDTFGQLVVKAASGSTGDMLNIGVDTANSVAFIQAVERGVNTIPLSLQRYGGNVGIGTTTPSSKLHVTDGGTLPTISGTYLISATSASNAGIQINAGNTSASIIAFGDTNSQDVGVIRYDHSDNHMRFNTNATEAMCIDSSGNVGIGTTSPESKLQVAGGIQMADDTATASADKVGTMRYRTGTEYVEVTGTELITNGDFASSSNWSVTGGWTISSGKANYATAVTSYLVQTGITLTSGVVYRLRFNVSGSSGNGAFIWIGNQAGNVNYLGASYKYYADGDFEEIFTMPSNQTAIAFYSQVASSNFSMDNVTLMEVTEEDASYADMCMQTGSSTYEWVNIVRNTY